MLFMQTVSKNPPSQEPCRPNALPNLIVPNHLSRGLDLGESLALLEAALLLEAHNLEAVEVGEGLAALLLELLLGPVALLPLGIDASSLPSLADGTGAGTTGKLLDDDGGEKGSGEGDDAAGSSELGVGRGAIDKDLCIAKNESFSFLFLASFNSVVSMLGSNIRACGRRSRRWSRGCRSRA